GRYARLIRITWMFSRLTGERPARARAETGRAKSERAALRRPVQLTTCSRSYFLHFCVNGVVTDCPVVKWNVPDIFQVPLHFLGATISASFFSLSTAV